MVPDTKAAVSSTWREDQQEIVWLLPVTLSVLALFLAGQVRGAEAGVTAFAVFVDACWKLLGVLPLLATMTLSVVLVRVMLTGSKRPLADVAGHLRRPFSSPMLATASLSPLLLMPLMLSSYGVLKMIMPLSVPFSWDDTFADWDRLLFLGRQPWTVTHAVFGGLPATVAIDRLYTLWVPLVSLAIVGFAFLAPLRLRAQFFLSFTAAWIILGVGGAYLFSSAGPCYAEQLGTASASEFAGLMARLHAHSEQELLGAVHWQQVLWDAHETRSHSFGMGISAMPSLHNSVAIIYALALAQVGRRAALAGWAFAAIVFLGSIHLGWHYAVDGIASAIATVLIWRCSGSYLDRAGYPTAALNGVGTPCPDLEPAARSA